MFDLEREVTAWSEGVHAGRCRGSAGAAELKDHLYCEIESARGEGLSDEAAFAEAVRKLGRAGELAAENAKNQSALGTACAVAEKLDGAGPKSRGLLLAHAIVWAAITVASALLAKASAASSSAFLWQMLLVLLPGWIATEQILRRALRAPRQRRI
jgi:hypothetical protein